MRASQGISGRISKAIQAQGINPSQPLALIDSSDQSIGFQSPQNRHPRSPWMPASSQSCWWCCNLDSLDQEFWWLLWLLGPVRHLSGSLGWSSEWLFYLRVKGPTLGWSLLGLVWPLKFYMCYWVGLVCFSPMVSIGSDSHPWHSFDFCLQSQLCCWWWLREMIQLFKGWQTSCWQWVGQIGVVTCTVTLEVTWFFDFWWSANQTGVFHPVNKSSILSCILWLGARYAGSLFLLHFCGTIFILPIHCYTTSITVFILWKLTSSTLVSSHNGWHDLGDNTVCAKMGCSHRAVPHLAGRR